MDEQERAFVEAFIDPRRRDRYRLLLAAPEHRHKILDRLNHQLDLRAGIATELPAGLAGAGLVAELERHGAPATCHVIADSSDCDGREMALAAAVSFATAHFFGVVLCCLPGRLAFYKPESPAPTFLLESG